MDTYTPKAGDEFTMYTGTVRLHPAPITWRGDTMVVGEGWAEHIPHPGHPIDELGRSYITVKIVD
jgi:hypothetical protein